PSWRDGFGRAGVWYWGPRPNEAPIDATHRRQDHLGELAPMDLPAETDGQAPIGAKVGEFGVGPRTQVENSHEKPVETEAPCVRCDRYGPDHAGEHIASWGADWRTVPLGGTKS
ncbi:MAG TPA: hypothetical protein VFX42_06175, partial [Gemmatimonadales bacterium]|nr:hypothetical protein [Gemmatimonadales bacterium]